MAIRRIGVNVYKPMELIKVLDGAGLSLHGRDLNRTRQQTITSLSQLAAVVKLPPASVFQLVVTAWAWMLNEHAIAPRTISRRKRRQE